MFKRIFWFSAVNIAVLFLISLILSLFNTQNYLAASGIEIPEAFWYFLQLLDLQEGLSLCGFLNGWQKGFIKLLL